MSITHEILHLFGGLEKISVVENFNLFKSRHKLITQQISPTLAENLQQLFIILNTKDVDLTLTLEMDNQDSVHMLARDPSSVNSKVDSLREQLDLVEPGDGITLEIRVDKDQAVNLDVFDLSEFARYLNTLSLQKSLEYWSKFIQLEVSSVNIWATYDGFSTYSLAFNSVYPVDCSANKPAGVNQVERDDRISKRDKCGHFANAAQYEFIPSDFQIYSGEFDSDLKDYFTGIFNSLLIVYLSDFSSIENNFIKYRLKGYKLLSEDLSFTKLKEHLSSELHHIYEWTYLEGNYIDKIGLARNIISIHLGGESVLSVEKGTSNSVESSYDLYLKENVKQYIEIKNKISEFIHAQSDRALDITKNMFSMFKTGLWTFTTFFITVFLLRVVNSGTFSGAISYEVFMVSILLIIFSFIYLIISVTELNSDRDRLLKKYSEIRNRYKDLLNLKDLSKIINEDEVKKTERKYINGKRNRYISAWIITNSLLLLLVMVLYNFGNNVELNAAKQIPQELFDLEFRGQYTNSEDSIPITQHQIRLRA